MVQHRLTACVCLCTSGIRPIDVIHQYVAGAGDVALRVTHLTAWKMACISARRLLPSKHLSLLRPGGTPQRRPDFVH